MSKSVVVIGLGFGDEGKGSICDHLCRAYNADMVVRFNGGAQAAHHVVLPDGRCHTFAQFGSGTFAGARTHLSRFMLVNPIFFLYEALHLEKIGIAYNKVTVEREALVTTPFHIAANRLRENTRGSLRHGSCGMGINETVADSELFPEEAIRIGDLDDLDFVRRKLKWIQERKVEECHLFATNEIEWGILTDTNLTDRICNDYANFAKAVTIVDESYLNGVLDAPGTVVFEGSQGVLLDQDFGFFPYVTRSYTTFKNVDLLIGDRPRQEVGVLRAYSTRHGPGPFPTEDSELSFPDHNSKGEWQGRFRTGYFDAVLANYALDAVCGVDDLALTCLDHIQKPIEFCTAYETPQKELLTDLAAPKAPTLAAQQEKGEFLAQCKPKYELVPVDSYIATVEKHVEAHVKLLSYGPTHMDKKWH
jgi:adenylosuccinate synthase